MKPNHALLAIITNGADSMHIAPYQEQQLISAEQLATGISGMVQVGAGGLGLQLLAGSCPEHVTETRESAFKHCIAGAILAVFAGPVGREDTARSHAVTLRSLAAASLLQATVLRSSSPEAAYSCSVLGCQQEAEARGFDMAAELLETSRAGGSSSNSSIGDDSGSSSSSYKPPPLLSAQVIPADEQDAVTGVISGALAAWQGLKGVSTKPSKHQTSSSTARVEQDQQQNQQQQQQSKQRAVGSRGKGKPPLAAQQRPRTRAAAAAAQAAQAAETALVEPAPAVVLPSKSSSSLPTTGAGVAEGNISTAAASLPPPPQSHKRPAEAPNLEHPCPKQQRMSRSSSNSSSSKAIAVPQPSAVVMREARNSLKQLAPAEQQLPCVLSLPGILDRCSRALLQERSLPGSVPVASLHTALKVCITAVP